MRRRLLILACSGAKARTPGAIPAVDRYRPGAYYQMLHALPRDAWPVVVILSAKHGFLSADQPIENYDRRMDAQRAAELIARAVHGSGERRSKPFVAVNCGAIPENLVESMLFGHEKGAFTGATEKHTGKFVEASGGTLFLGSMCRFR